ncbi:F-box/kelch-repeat protein-like protein isoform X1 [Tanacetum coccineum]
MFLNKKGKGWESPDEERASEDAVESPYMGTIQSKGITRSLLLGAIDIIENDGDQYQLKHYIRRQGKNDFNQARNCPELAKTVFVNCEDIPVHARWIGGSMASEGNCETKAGPDSNPLASVNGLYPHQFNDMGLKMEYFSPDVAEKILLLLDPKSTILCKSVCKLWNNIISEHSFVKLNLMKSVESDARNDKFNERRILISGSAHALSSGNRLAKPLRSPIFRNNTSYCWGFGVAGCEESDYKVILGGFDTLMGGMTSFEVLDVNANVWKNIPIEQYKYRVIHTSRRGVFCHNDKCLNWLITNHEASEEVVLSYDLSKEDFKEIRPPYDEFYEYDLDCSLGSRGDRLCIKGYENGKGSRSRFWVLNNGDWELVDHDGFGYDAANFLKSCKYYMSCEGPLLEDGIWYTCE